MHVCVACARYSVESNQILNCVVCVHVEGKNHLTKGVFDNNGTAISACSLVRSLLERGSMGHENASLFEYWLVLYKAQGILS